MRRGFMLTAITVVLFMVLIDTALQYSESSAAYSETISAMIVSEKVSYTFDDITEDITQIVGLNVTQQASNLIMRDSIPGVGIVNNLNLYENFFRSYYLTPEMTATFMNANDQQINLRALSTNITVSPFNLTYGYSDFGKNNLSIQIPLSQSPGVQYVWYNLTVTSSNFTNISQIAWSPAPPSCIAGSLGCIKFYLAVNDSMNNQYQPIYNYFNMTGTAGYVNVSFSNLNCSTEIRLGGQYLLNLTNHGCKISSQIGFNFNSSNLQLYFPEKLSINDINYNTFKKDNINVIVAKTLQ